MTRAVTQSSAILGVQRVPGKPTVTVQVPSENQGRRGLQPSTSPATSSAPEPTHTPTSFRPKTPKRVKRKPVTVPDAPSKRRRMSDSNALPPSPDGGPAATPITVVTRLHDQCASLNFTGTNTHASWHRPTLNLDLDADYSSLRMSSEHLFRRLLNSVHYTGFSFLTDCRYGTHFEPHQCVDGSFAYRSCHDAKPFRPLIFGEVKEIIYGTEVTDGKDMSTVATLNLGLPKVASHLVDTFFWNQLVELDYGMRREAADNDSEAHMLPFGDYVSLDYSIPWSQGPTGEPSDRIFARIAFDCHMQRSLPSTLQFPSHLPSRSFSSMLKNVTSDFLTAKSSISAQPTSSVLYSTQSAAVPGSILPSGDPDQDQVDPDYVDLEDCFTSSTVCDWRSISVGDFVVIVGELLRTDYAHNNNFVRVYTITALALNIVI
ncbi:hypothetical protein DFH07DRAFT_970949 [Mycena maculata]|uniref:Uncharacterized protein n=1 Tax=Mycena maculata TaxID=230809 RepID=A0AAD7HQS5_9AGAR|nr:hypothetical protein DFH07DRAFT_970949 [Mycena maculata]